MSEIENLIGLPSTCTTDDYDACYDSMCDSIEQYGTWLQLSDAYNGETWFFILELSS